MEWSDLEVFLAAVRTGSYTAAGRLLHLNRTTVGRRVDALEEALGQPLFEETPTGPAPTRAGTRLLAAAEAMEREVAAMLDDMAVIGRSEGPVRIASSAGIASELLPEVAAYRRLHPGTTIELLGSLDPLEALAYRRADLAIALMRNPPLRFASVQIATLSQTRYGLRGAGPLEPLGWGFEFDAALPGGPWWSANPAGEAAQAAGLVTCNTWPQLKEAVLAGVGSAVLWCFAGDTEPTLERLGPPDPRHDCPLWLLRRSKAPPSPVLRDLCVFLKERLAQRLIRTDGC